ncbi:MAG: acetyltransferase [Phycisphaerales bacterium]|nr:MAG: acetyltransferase [Phycisphaerales bacterium]
MRDLVIWGCGGMAREINHLCEQLGRKVVGFLDERSPLKGTIVDDVPVLGDISDIGPLCDEVAIVCAGVGDPALKKHFAEKTNAAGFQLAGPLVHPAIRLSARSSVQDGSVLCEGVVITVNVHIGRHVVINRNATLGHDAEVGDYVTVSPGANVSGNVRIGEGCFVGTGASIREKIEIGPWAVVGGGAFVKDDVPAGCTVVGVPASVLEQ